MGSIHQPYRTQAVDAEPVLHLRAADPHAVTILRALAAKHRVTDHVLADRLEESARVFEAWRRAFPAVRL